MPTLRPGPADRELQRLIEIFLKAETDIINEIGRLRTQGLVDYHAEAALERVQAILRKLENDCWIYVPRMIETQFYVKHPDARKPMEEPETPEKHLRGYQNARVLTSEQTDIVQRLSMNLLGEIDAATATVTATLQNALIGRIESDIFRRVGLEQAAAMQATGRGVYKELPKFVEVLRREGITAFVDRAGRHWSLHTYGSMVLRTTSRQAEVLSVLTENPDHDLYKISSHGTTCKLCASLEGRVYSKSGTDPDFPPLAAAFGKVDKAGPDTLSNTYLNIHPSCLHSIVAWTPMGRSEEELRKIKDFSSFEKNPVTQDPRTKKQIEAYRKKEEARARFLRDYKQWERYRETIGDPIPKRFETFRKHKYAVLDPETGKYKADDKFRSWEKSYRAANKVEKSVGSGIMEPNKLKETPKVSKSHSPILPAEKIDTARPLLSQDITEDYVRVASPGKGMITYDDGYDLNRHQSEVNFAQKLYKRFGGDLKLLNESRVEGEKRADYLWNGRLWDLKDVTTEKAANTAIKRGLSQIEPNPGGVILNYGNRAIDMRLLLEVIDKRMQWLKDGSCVDIMVVLEDGNIKIWRYDRKR